MTIPVHLSLAAFVPTPSISFVDVFDTFFGIAGAGAGAAAVAASRVIKNDSFQTRTDEKEARNGAARGGK